MDDERFAAFVKYGSASKSAGLPTRQTSFGIVLMDRTKWFYSLKQ